MKDILRTKLEKFGKEKKESVAVKSLELCCLDALATSPMWLPSNENAASSAEEMDF